jgi:hypothetical protein
MRSKSYVSDWSKEELEEVLCFLFFSTSRTTCLFIDGLDEVDSSDGYFRLLELIEKFLNFPCLKICVSSRAEPILKDFLERFPHLRVQDLTRQAMRQYATNFLQPYFKSDGEEFRKFIWAVCERADGVFLWVALVLKSLRDGRVNKDSLDELWKRLETMPKDLNKLYSQMWLRLNENEPIYRQDAAFFFQLALDHSKFLVGAWPLSSYQVLLAYNRAMADAILNDCTALQPKDFIKEHQAVVEQLEIRCAGLLEVSSQSSTVSFMHRSAIEFLENTPDGIQILQYESRDVGKRHFDLFKSSIISLARLYVCPSFRISIGLDGLPAIMDVIEDIQTALVDRRQSKSNAFELMHLCQSVYELGAWLPFPNSSEGGLRPDFLGLAAGNGFIEFVAAAVESLKAHAPNSAVLDEYNEYLLASTLTFVCDSPRSFQLAEWLLRERIDTSTAQYFITDFEERRRFFIAKRSLLAQVLAQLVVNQLHYRPEIPSVIRQLLENGSQLSDNTILRICRNRQSEPYIFLNEFDKWFPIRNGTLVPEPNIEVFAKINLSFMLTRYIEGVDEGVEACKAEELCDLSNLASRVPETVEILSFFVQRNGAYRGFALSIKTDHDYLLDTLKSITRVRGDSEKDRDELCAYNIPELYERSMSVAERSQEISHKLLGERLLREDLVVKQEDLGPWPPQLF